MSEFEKAHDFWLKAFVAYAEIDHKNVKTLHHAFLTTVDLGKLDFFYTETPKYYLEALQMAIKLSENNPERYLPALAKIRLTLGLAYLKADDYYQSVRNLVAAKDIYLNLPDNGETFVKEIDMMKAILESKEGDKIAAEKLFEAIVPTLSLAGPGLLATEDVFIEKRLHIPIYMGEPYTVSQTIYEKCISYQTNSQNTLHLANSHYGLGHVALINEDNAESLDHFLKSRRFYNENTGLPQEQIALRTDTLDFLLTRLYAKNGYWDEAIALIDSLLSKKLEQADKSDEHYYQVAELYATKGELMSFYGRQTEAAKWLKKAIATMDENDLDCCESYALRQEINLINTEEDALYDSLLAATATLEKSIEQTRYKADKIPNQKELIAAYQEAYQKYPDHKDVKSRLAKEYGNLAWYSIFAGEYDQAETAALKGLKTDRSQKWINTNLALSHLMLGNLPEAKKIYNRYILNNTLLIAFITDLDDLEEAGIYHESFPEIRKLLNEFY
ncbi:tetratricopeptide repeat protein [Roseivirga sp. BDSF3-8]|uniref:tetratricopeptide repeat protein n=1 Tax=Roseivirga sp. BDSF3-8 TaxID=3241598 RepID=UPI003531FB23